MNLSTAKRLRYTKLLVLISILGSLLSILTGAIGWGEVYPFATWKLYTQPLGNKHTFTEYRIYIFNPEQQKWERQSVVTDSPNFTEDEYVYTLNHLVAASLADSPDTTTYKNKLKAFVTYVAPAAPKYKIVQEIYRPIELLENPLSYDTLTVIRF